MVSATYFQMDQQNKCTTFFMFKLPKFCQREETVGQTDIQIDRNREKIITAKG